jgi:hypothetical protein
MTPHRILNLNAVSTAACALGMLITRGMLYPLFGLTSPILLDVIAIGLLGYAAALAYSARQQPVTRSALIFFTAVDALWVAASAVVLLVWWNELAIAARVLVVAVALAVEVFATLQFNAAGGLKRRSAQMA